MDKKLTELKDKVWMTRKARINASQRLICLEKFIQYVNIYYSCFLCILSIYGLTTTNDKIGIISTILSVILTISIVYLNSQKFGDRAQQLKNNYISLQKLLFRLDNLDGNITCDLTKLQDEYIDLLSNCENHSNSDYYKIQLRDGKIEVISKLGLIYYIYKIFGYICGFIVIFIPFSLVFYIF